MRFLINGKDFLLARKSPDENIVSNDYFFTNTFEEIPQTLVKNISEDDLKKIIEAEFKIDEKVTFPFGGKAVRAGSKISPRYFFMFNTISEDIITNNEIYFDKQSNDRYKEALPRIFDLAMGIDSVENIIYRERKQKLESEMAGLIKKQERAVKKYDLFRKEISIITQQAIAYGLVDEDFSNNPLDAIKTAINQGLDDKTEWKGLHDEITLKIASLNKKLRSINKLSREYDNYKNSLNTAEDSIKPLTALKSHSNELIQSTYFFDIIQDLNFDLKRIKASISNKNPVDSKIRELRQKYLDEKELLVKQLQALPASPDAFRSEREKWMFIGELKGKISTYVEEETNEPLSYKKEIEKCRSDIRSIRLPNIEERKEAAIRTIEREAGKYLRIAGDALDNYADYIPAFIYSEKKIRLQKPGKLTFENVGSSSNHMFLHLIHFLALQSLALSQKSPFIPSFLLIDQPSRPYYGDKKQEIKKLNTADTYKIKKAFDMLDQFITQTKTNYNSDFQIILLDVESPTIV